MGERRFFMIDLNIKHTEITVSNLLPLATGNKNSIFISFGFSDEWAPLSRVAVFRNGDTRVSVALTGDSCAIPWEVLENAGRLYIALRGIGTGGETVLCTESKSLGTVEKSTADSAAEEAREASASVIDSITDDICELKSGCNTALLGVTASIDAPVTKGVWHSAANGDTEYYLAELPATLENGRAARLSVGISETPMTAGDFARETSSPFVINGGGFNDSGLLGPVIKDGEVVNGDALISQHHYDCMYFDDDGIMHIVTDQNGKSASSLMNMGAVNCITAFAGVVINGEKRADTVGEQNIYEYWEADGNGTVNPRTMLCQKQDGTVFAVVCGGRVHGSVGMTYEDMADLALEYGAYNAYCCDGGGSSQMCVNGLTVNAPIDGAGTVFRKVRTFWYVRAYTEDMTSAQSLDRAETYELKKDIYEKAVGQKTGVKTAEIFNDYTRNTANAAYSHAEGIGTKANAVNGQHVQGRYNIEQQAEDANKYADIVGWGTADNARKNISALDVGGTLHLKGDAYVNCDDDSTNGKKLATEEYVNTHGGGGGGGGSDVGQHDPDTSTGEIFNDYTNNTANGNYAHAEGYSTHANAPRAHTEGHTTSATANQAHAEGYGTKASSQNQHAQGRFNVEDSNNTYADIVGWGANDSNRKNISALGIDGTLHLKGDVYVGCDDDSTNGSKLLTLADLPLYNGGVV